MRNRRVLHLMLGGLALSVAALAGGPVSAATLTVGKADANASTILPVNIAEKLGIYKKHGIDVKIVDFTGGSKMSQAVAAGSVDIGVGAGTEMAFVSKGAPMLAVCEAVAPIPTIGIAVPWESPIHTIDELKGKRIGISSANSFTDWLARELTNAKGWGPDGITRVTIGNGAVANLAAFRTHAVDATIAVTPNIFNWEEHKQARLLIPVSDYVGNIASGTIYARREVMDKNPDALRDFLAAWLDTIGYIVAHKTETVKIESELTGFSESVMAKEYDLSAHLFSRDCKFDSASLENLKRAFIQQKLVNTPPDMSKLYTEAFLPTR